MPEPLHPWLLLLVMLNLTFVQLTGTVDGAWMAGLWIATASAPLVIRWRGSIWYRITWNGLVLGAFVFLLQHALTTGLLHMLEDGLLLAALCQVHLMNNIGSRQKPDLLFFNSFLIAFVTSFFCHDLAWSLCFVAYAASLVPALQIYVTLGSGRETAPGALRPLLRDSLPRAVVAIACTALVFVLWPRDFRHRGFLDDTLRLAAEDYVAFTEEIRFDRTTTPTLSDAPVLRIRPGDGRPESVPAYWRGVTFVQFDGRGWRAYDPAAFGARQCTDVAWQAIARNEWRRPGEPRDPPLELRVLDPGAGRVFLPQQASQLVLRNAPPPLLEPKGDGVVALSEPSMAPTEVRATVRLGSFAPPFRPRPNTPQMAPLRRPPETLPMPLSDIAREVRRTAGTSADPHGIAEAARTWLETHRRYALPGANGAARSLDEFLLGAGGGHCEYFATALALLLRAHDIPCRVVGGYLAHEWDAANGEVVARQRDAHAWVEMLGSDGSWVTLDATPPAAMERPGAASAWWQEFTRSLQDAWHSVTAFDEHGRRRLVAWAWDGLCATLGQPWLLALIAAAASIWHWRRRRRQPASVRELTAAMRRAGVQPLPGETPRELLARAALRPIPPRRQARLVAAVAAHEAARYGGAAE